MKSILYFLSQTFLFCFAVTAADWVYSAEEFGLSYRARLTKGYLMPESDSDTDASDDEPYLPTSTELIEIEYLKDGKLFYSLKAPLSDIICHRHGSKSKKLISIERLKTHYVVINTDGKIWGYKPITFEAEDGKIVIIDNFQRNQLIVNFWNSQTGSWISKEAKQAGVSSISQDAKTGEISKQCLCCYEVFVSEEQIQTIRKP